MGKVGGGVLLWQKNPLMVGSHFSPLFRCIGVAGGGGTSTCLTDTFGIDEDELGQAKAEDVTISIFHAAERVAKSATFFGGSGSKFCLALRPCPSYLNGRCRHQERHSAMS